MEGFNIVDGAILSIVLVSAILAYARGLVRELMSIASWIAAAFVAFVFAPQVKPLVKEIPVVGPILSDSCELGIIASFVAVFAVSLVIFSFFTPLLSSVIDKTGVGSADRALGFLFGVFRGVALIAILFFAYKSIFNTETFALVDESRSAEIFGNLVNNIEQSNPERALGWITHQYEQLVTVCSAP